MADFLYSIFNKCCSRRKQKQAAGVLFTNGIHVLAGYQPYKKKPIISGIGGVCEPGESIYETTMREMFEELFEIKAVPKTLLKRIKNTIPRREKVKISKHYTFTVYSFEDLHKILGLAADLGLTSPLYPRGFPTTVVELIFQRSDTQGGEVRQLVLLPVAEDLRLDAEFIEDINHVTSLF